MRVKAEENSVKPKGGLGKKKALRAAAVTITCPPGQYSDVIGRARGKINIAELEIPRFRAHKGVTGAMVYEITGKNREKKADLFAQKLREVIGDAEGVRIARPVKTVELRMRGLDEATTVEEVRAKLAQLGGCGPDDVKVGPIRFVSKALGTVWVRCPIVPAQKILEVGRLQIGWVHANVELLRDRPMQCYKCMSKGHVQEHCTSEMDRQNACYNCGTEGHLARDCRNSPKCMICEEAGVPSAHRMGSTLCTPPKKKRNTGGKGANSSKNPTSGDRSSRMGKAAPKVPPATEKPLRQRDSNLGGIENAATTVVQRKKKEVPKRTSAKQSGVVSEPAKTKKPRQTDEAMEVVEEGTDKPM